jgi:hypothetical protein
MLSTFLKFQQDAEPLKLVVGNLVRSSQRFMEPEGSLHFSEDLVTGSYPEPDESNPLIPIS